MAATSRSGRSPRRIQGLRDLHSGTAHPWATQDDRRGFLEEGGCYRPAVIRAILHLLNDQPLSVDLLDDPKPSDMAVICTNVRSMDGKRPVFIDFSDSTFVIPMASVRFVEIPTGVEQAERARAAAAAADAESADDAEDLEIDEDFLRRVREA